MKLSQRIRITAALLSGLLVLSLGTAVLAPAPAVAASDNPDRAYSRAFTSNWVFRSTKLKRCSFISVTGTITGKWRYAYRLPSGALDKNTLLWTGVAVKNPAVHVTGWPITAAGCDSTRRWKIKANIFQGWQEYSCRVNVSLSYGYPWSVSATPSVKCGNKKNGHMSSTEGPSTKVLHQYNSGAPVKFGSMLTPASGGALLQNVNVRMYTGNASDLLKKNVTVYLKR